MVCVIAVCSAMMSCIRHDRYSAISRQGRLLSPGTIHRLLMLVFTCGSKFHHTSLMETFWQLTKAAEIAKAFVLYTCHARCQVTQHHPWYSVISEGKVEDELHFKECFVTHSKSTDNTWPVCVHDCMVYGFVHVLAWVDMASINVARLEHCPTKFSQMASKAVGVARSLWSSCIVDPSSSTWPTAEDMFGGCCGCGITEVSVPMLKFIIAAKTTSFRDLQPNVNPMSSHFCSNSSFSLCMLKVCSMWFYVCSYNFQGSIRYTFPNCSRGTRCNTSAVRERLMKCLPPYCSHKIKVPITCTLLIKHNYSNIHVW